MRGFGVSVGVALDDHFPATAWLWRRLNSRWARRLFLSLIVLLLLLTTALRVWAFMFEHRVNSIVAGLAQLHLDQTTKSEMLKFVPALRPGELFAMQCQAQECYSFQFASWGDNSVLRLIHRNKLAYTVVYWLGLRDAGFSAEVRLQEGKVNSVGYGLIVDNGFLGLVFDAQLTHTIGNPDEYPIDEQSPNYRVTSFRKWPETTLHVVLTPGASSELHRHAFDVRLNCMWQLFGCRTPVEILPSAWRDKQRIAAAARARLLSENPCPDHLLNAKAREMSNILLLQVERVQLDPQSRDEWKRVLVDYRLVKVLKGTANQPLKSFPYYMNLSLPGFRETIPNFALKLLQPGTTILMISSDDKTVGSACQIVAATPSALQTIRVALASPASESADQARPNR